MELPFFTHMNNRGCFTSNPHNRLFKEEWATFVFSMLLNFVLSCTHLLACWVIISSPLGIFPKQSSYLSRCLPLTRAPYSSILKNLRHKSFNVHYLYVSISKLTEAINTQPILLATIGSAIQIPQFVPHVYNSYHRRKQLI